MYSLASNNYKYPYEVKCHIRAQWAPPAWSRILKWPPGLGFTFGQNQVRNSGSIVVVVVVLVVDPRDLSLKFGLNQQQLRCCQHWVPCGWWVMCKVLFMSTPTCVRLEWVEFWLSWGCDKMTEASTSLKLYKNFIYIFAALLSSNIMIQLM